MTQGWRNLTGFQDRERELLRALRVRGFNDGYAGKPCASQQIDYAQAWRRGVEQRRDFLLNDLDDD